MSKRAFLTVCTALVLGLAASPLRALAQAPPPSPAAQPPNDYGDPNTWLCLPGRQDACAVDEDATIVAADGTLTPDPWRPNPDAPIDCFYVYPTVSNDPTPNSDMTPGPEERGVVAAQAARFGSKCRVFAPIYRQVTLAALRARLLGHPMAADPALAYRDVRDAWTYYLEHYNHGRGVVLIGHSQGSGVLTALIQHEIDGKPIQARLVSAILAGTRLAVPPGRDVGGAFQSVPLCRSNDQTGCAIAFASFRANSPPPADSLFGRVQEPGMVAACTNPAALGGGSGPLKAYLPAHGTGIVVDALPPGPWTNPPKPIDTPFVEVPGLLTAECISDAHGSYLAVTVHPSPGGSRVNDVVGDVVVAGQVRPEWGLHLIDMNLTMGNLLDIVDAETRAYLAKAGR